MEPDEFMQEDNDRGGGEDEGMEQHKSVIMHLIKQVRIGMDLTKGNLFRSEWSTQLKLPVVLPTFILERRSLLEMYSDFFAHADFYSEIPKCTTPRERMISVVKWYLTSFHAGRNGSVAKKVTSKVKAIATHYKYQTITASKSLFHLANKIV